MPRCPAPLLRRIVWLQPFLPGNDHFELLLSELPKTIQVRDLRLDRGVRAMKPEPTIGAAVNAERAAKGTAKPARFDGVLLGKHLDAIAWTRALHRHSQPQRNVVNVDTAVFRQQRPGKKNPEMPPSPAQLERGFNSVLDQPTL